MADTVRGIMEGMVPELEDYVARGYFSDGEVSSIIQNRQKFEYALRRRNADKQDFLRYCDYEWKLEQLRQLRRKKREISGKRSLADYGIVRRIHFIYDRATRKFKGDVAIWMSWLQFCKESNSKRQVSKVVTKALKLHPCAPYFWAYAAAWEFEGNSNPAAARQLLQSGLRHCPSDGSLWVEYFRMELLYANKLKARRKVLGLDDQENDDAPQEPSEGTAADKIILQGKLATVVHKTAVGKLPHHADMRLNMLRAVNEVAIESSDDLKRTIVNSFVEDLGDNGGACCKLATVVAQGHASQLGSGLQSACEFLKERITVTEDAQLQKEAVEWASNRMLAEDEQVLARVCPDNGAQQSIWAVDSSSMMNDADQGRHSGKFDDDSCCEQLCEWIIQCADMKVTGGCTEDVIAKKLQALLRSGQISQALDELKRAIQDRSKSVVLWHSALRMGMASVGETGANEEVKLFGYTSMTDLVSASLRSTRGVAGWEELIPPSVACLAAMKEPLDAVMKPLLDSLATASVDGEGQHVAQALEATWLLEGKDAGIALAEKIAAMPSPGVEFWAMYAQLCIQSAPRNASKKLSKKNKKAIDEVFERAVQVHGHDSEIWLQWIRFLETAGRGEAVQITQRAVACLPPKAADSLTLQLRET